MNPFLRSHSSSGDFLPFIGLSQDHRRAYYGDLGASPPFTTSLSFLPYVMPNAPSNPESYVPTFFLVNKPSGEGKRDTGILYFN